MLRGTLAVCTFVFIAFLITKNFVQNTLTASTSPEIIPPYCDFTCAYQQFFENEMKEHGSPGAAVVLVKDTSIIFMKGFGEKEIGKKNWVDPHTVFRIGSLSKGFAAALAGIEAGKSTLDLDDKVVQYLPYFELSSSEQTQEVAVKHLLSHSSGLPYHTYTDLVENGRDVKTIAKEFKNVALIGKPGEIYAYQNAAYGLIEEILLETSGLPFQQLLEEKIFNPAHMADASVKFDDMISTENKALPHTYLTQEEAWQKTEISKKYYNLPSTGGINASISDMANWLKVLMGYHPEIMDKKTLDLIFEPFIESKNQYRYFREWSDVKQADYAMGWRVVNMDEDTIIYHGGYVNGYRSEIAFNRKEKIGICILFNAPAKMANYSISVFWEMYKKFKYLNKDSL